MCFFMTVNLLKGRDPVIGRHARYCGIIVCQSLSFYIVGETHIDAGTFFLGGGVEGAAP